MQKWYLLLLLLSPLQAYTATLNIEQAYAAIPHRYTAFSINDPNIQANDQRYLSSLLNAVNQAIIARVLTLQWLYSAGEQGNSPSDYRSTIKTILLQVNPTQLPNHLQPAVKQVRTAIETQRRYFDKWEQKISQGEHFQFERNDLHIQTAHRLLIQSYNKLIKLYPNSSAQNRQAFYDHLCALDFI